MAMGKKHKPLRRGPAPHPAFDPAARPHTTHGAADHSGNATTAVKPQVAPPATGMAALTTQQTTPQTTTPGADSQTSDRPPPPRPVPLEHWHVCGDAITGLKHRRAGLPCQDAVAYTTTPRPLLALSDGAGSAAISEQGAQTLVGGSLRLLHTLEDDLAALLDAEADPADLDAAGKRWAQRLLRHARGLLVDLARHLRRETRDVRATLLLVAIGTRRLMWWRVGDGAIVARSASSLRVLGDMGRPKGEFANQTCFVDAATMADVQYGLLPVADIDGIALMSDGGAEKLVAHDGTRVANRLAQWLDELAQQRFGIERIALAYHEPAMWERTTLDDRALLLAARPAPSSQPGKADQAPEAGEHNAAREKTNEPSPHTCDAPSGPKRQEAMENAHETIDGNGPAGARGAGGCAKETLKKSSRAGEGQGARSAATET